MLNDTMDFQALGRLFPIRPVGTPRHPFQEPALFYHPPYETEAEDELAYRLVGLLAEECGLQYRVSMHTSYASFRVAFLIEKGRQRVAIQVTRRGEGEDPAEADFHDTLLVDAGLVDILYRFDEADVRDRPFDVLCLIARWNPGLFNERGVSAIEAQASPAARAFAPTAGQESGAVSLVTPSAEDEWQGESFVWPSEEAGLALSCRRLSRYHPAGWMRDVDEALARFGVTADHLRTAWAKSA